VAPVPAAGTPLPTPEAPPAQAAPTPGPAEGPRHTCPGVLREGVAPPAPLPTAGAPPESGDTVLRLEISRRHILGLMGLAGLALAIGGQWLLSGRSGSAQSGALTSAALLWAAAIALSWPLFRWLVSALNVSTLNVGTFTLRGLRNVRTFKYGRPGGSPLPLGVRRLPAAVAAAATVAAYWFNSDNTFTGLGVLAWAVAVAGWFVALWEGPLPRLSVERLWRGLEQREYALRISRLALLLGAVLVLAAFFRYSQLGGIPPEMTSDHVEKLLDVNDVLNGARNVFFPRNTGREFVQFYFAAAIARVLGTGLSFLTLKISAATAGFLTIPFIFLLGRELEDDLTGLLAATLAAFAFWPEVISRVGLRFPFNPLFAAPALYFAFRGLRRGGRNDFLWAGLALGLGLNGYSPFRFVPVALGVIFLLYLAFPQNNGGRARLIPQFVALSAVTLAVCAPLLRYSVQNPEMFWYRAAGRLTGSEHPLPGPAWEIFLNNQKNGLGMFNYTGDQVWVNTLPGRPALDFWMGGLLVLGAAFVIYRLAVRRSLRDALLLLLVPVLLLPSTLSLAFPNENPSAARAGAAVVVVYIFVALPLSWIIRYFRERFPGSGWGYTGWAAAAVVLALSAQVNYRMYFVEYPRQYVGSAQNASEIGQVIYDFSRTIGSYETAYMIAFPYWVDTRAVGMYAGKFGWDNTYPPGGYDQLSVPVTDPRNKLFILHPDDRRALGILRQLYPTGTLSQYHSARPNPSHQFLLYFVPGTQNLDESTLPAPPG
ncbi:MAG: glycosyltransferase family 39 protein, partial [Chloroflexi bacterium]|nr:glycosyltransferase family 39 protein [Chloroflexota bacterium]